MKTIQNTMVFIVVTLLSLMAAITTHTFKSVDAWMLPRIVSYVILMLSVAGTVKSVIDGIKGGDAGSDKDVQVFKKEEFWPLMEMLIWLLGFVLTTYLVGFYPSIFVFAFTYMRRQKRKWSTAVLFPVLLTALLYVLFRLGLSTILYEGLLFMRRH